MSKMALYVSIPDGELRWEIKQAALHERTTVRALVIGILSDWLTAHGYHDHGDPDNSKRAMSGTGEK